MRFFLPESESTLPLRTGPMARVRLAGVMDPLPGRLGPGAGAIGEWVNGCPWFGVGGLDGGLNDMVRVKRENNGEGFSSRYLISYVGVLFMSRSWPSWCCGDVVEHVESLL